MAEPLPGGIEIQTEDDRVKISVGNAVWEGSAAEAERVLTGLHYALARARPGTNISSVFVNGSLWGGKSIETNPLQAIRNMRSLVVELGELLDSTAEKEAAASHRE